MTSEVPGLDTAAGLHSVRGDVATYLRLLEVTVDTIAKGFGT